MKVFLSLSDEARLSKDPNAKGPGMGYMGSRFLAEAFFKRGHDLNIVHPTQIFESGEGLCCREIYSINQDGFYLKSTEEPIIGDVFFVYSLDEERGSEASKTFMNRLYQIESQLGVVLNSSESTSYEDKSKQKTLNLPWIPEFKVKDRKELSDLVASGKKIIAKPRVGACGLGIRYLDSGDSVQNMSDIENYLFEEFVPANEERRYIFLDGECIIRRRLGKEGFPGKERANNVKLFEGVKEELDIARRSIELTGMFYGAVDFRGPYVLEINGSGTGIAPPTVNNEIDCYNLSDPIVQAVERKVEKV